MVNSELNLKIYPKHYILTFCELKESPSTIRYKFIHENKIKSRAWDSVHSKPNPRKNVFLTPFPFSSFILAMNYYQNEIIPTSHSLSLSLSLTI